MRLSLPAYAIDLTSYALYISSLVISPLIANKYFVLFGIPASCSVLVVPITLFFTHFVTQKYGFGYGYNMVKHSVIVGIVMAGFFWLVNLIPMHAHSVVSADAWDEVLGVCPGVTICWTLLCGLAQWGIVWCSQHFLLRPFLLYAVVGCGSLAGWLPLVCLVYMGVLPIPYEVLGGSLVCFSLFTLASSMGVYTLECIIGRACLIKGQTYRVSTPTFLHGLYPLLLTLYGLVLLLTNIVAVKWFAIKSYFFTVGLLSYPFTFVGIDLITELYGKQRAKYAVWMGFVASTSMMVTVGIATWMPIYEASPLSQKAFVAVFGFTPGIVLASMLAYVIGQFTDLYLLESLRMRTQGRHLWLRNNMSTMVGQFIDTLVFSFFVWVIWPKLDVTSSTTQVATSYWYQLAINEYVGKILLALLATPLVYASIRLLKRYA